MELRIFRFLIICSACFHGAQCHAADLQEIVRRGTITIGSDWAADPDYACVERDEIEKNQKSTSKTYQVVTMAGSDYNMTLAIGDRLLSPDQQRAELQKLKNESQRRQREDPAGRRRRLEKYKKQRDENGALLLDFPNAFNFALVREETMNGYPAYVLSGTPKKRTGPMSRAAKVLSGMDGTLWIDKENFHVIRAECNVVTPVPIYGILAQVYPGTHIELELAPVTDSIWLISRLSMDLTLSKLWFKSEQITHSTYSKYSPNVAMLEELLSNADQQ